MNDIAKKTKSNIAERIAVMAALNCAHEYLALKNQPHDFPVGGSAETGLDFGAVRRRISDMEAKLEAVLEPQEKLL